jgi:hypothetical protein
VPLRDAAVGPEDRAVKAMLPQGASGVEIEDEKMSVEVKSVSVEPNRVYRFHLGGRYSPLGVSRHCHTGQRTVVYRSLEADDLGDLYNAPMVDWALKFSPTDEFVERN